MSGKYEVLILDLDGTVYVDGKPLGNVINQLNELIRRNILIIFLSNNTSVSKENYVLKLKKLGLNIGLENVITPTEIAANYLKSHGLLNGYIIGTKDMENELNHNHGIVHDNHNAQFVLLGFDKELTYQKLQKACEFINAGVPYYITHIDLACPSEKGPIPDCGSIYELVKSVTQKLALTDFGKPSISMVKYIKDKLKDYDKSKVLMGGDRLYTDIALGLELGVDTLVVYTGETSESDIEKSNIKPTFRFEKLEEFIEWHYIIK